MIKQIPVHLFAEEMNSNISYFNMKLLIENYERVFDLNNFTYPNYCKFTFQSIINSFKNCFEIIKNTEPLQEDQLSIEEQEYLRFMKDTNFQDFNKDNNHPHYFSFMENIIQNNPNLYIQVIKSFLNSKPLIAFNSSVPSEENILTSFFSNNEDYLSMDYLSFLNKSSNNMSISDYHVIKYIYSFLHERLLELDPRNFTIKERDRLTYEALENYFSLDEKNEYEQTDKFNVFKVWFEEEFLGDSSSKFSLETKAYTLSYTKPSSKKHFLESYIYATNENVEEQYKKPSYPNLYHLYYRASENTYDRMQRIIKLFNYSYSNKINSFLYSVNELVKYMQIENKKNTKVQKKMFNNNLLFVRKKTNNTNLLNHMSYNHIEKPIDSSFIKDKISNKCISYEATQFKTRLENESDILYSHYNEEIINLFLTKSLDFSNEEIFNNYKTEMQLNTQTLTEPFNISMGLSSSHFIDQSSLNQQQIGFIKDYIQNNQNKKVKCIYVPQLDNKSRKKHLFLQNISLKTLLKKSGFLIPIKLPFKALNEKNKEETFTAFTFLNLNLSLENTILSSMSIFIRKHSNYFTDNNKITLRNHSRDSTSDESKSFNAVFKMINDLFSFDSIILTDLIKFKEKLSDYYSGIDKYHDNNLELVLLNKTANSLSNSKDSINIGNDYSNPTFANVLAKVKVDKKIERKYNNINKKYNALLEKKQSKKNEIKDHEYELNNLNGLISKYTQQLIEAEKRKNEHVLSYVKLIETIEPVEKAYNDIKTSYTKDFDERVELNQFTLDPYLKNLISNNINVSYILFEDEETSKKLFYYNKEDYETLKSYNKDLCSKYYESYDCIKDCFNQIYNHDFYTFKKVTEVFSILRNQNWKIKQISFTTIKPSLIKVDNSENYVVGGPYRVILTNDTMYIGLLNIASIFGAIRSKNVLNTIKAHPHSSPINITQTDKISKYLTPRSACLGEASTLIYKGFANKDLSTIIISTMIWIKSANSSDFWGKSYKFFPKPEEVNCDFEKLKSMPSIEEINSFIDDVIETDTEEAQPVEIVAIEEDQETSNSDSERTIETYNTESTYVRYT